MKTNQTDKVETSFDNSLKMACENLESIGCDGNAIELCEHFAALVAVAKAHETLILAMNEVDRRWLPSTATSSTWIRKVLLESEQAHKNLATVREGGAK